MAGNIFLKQGTHTSCISGGSALNTGQVVQAGTNLANSTALDEYVDLLLTVQFGTGPNPGDVIALFMAPILGGNSPTYDAGIPFIAEQYHLGDFPVIGSASPQYITIYDIPLGPYDYVLWLQNNTTQNTNSGLSLDAYGWQHQYT